MSGEFAFQSEVITGWVLREKVVVFVVVVILEVHVVAVDVDIRVGRILTERSVIIV